jgi:hypothetical protein
MVDSGDGERDWELGGGIILSSNEYKRHVWKTKGGIGEFVAS